MRAPESRDRWRGRVALKCIVWCAAVCAATTVVQAEGAEIGDFVGKSVVAVRLVSDGQPIHDTAVLELVETQVGVRLSMRQVRESVTHLFSLGLFETVEVEGSLLGDGVALEYDLIPLQVIERIEFEGNRSISAGDARQVVVETHGSTFCLDQIDGVGDTLRRFYRERGFLRATVQTEVDTADGRVLRVQVEAGPRAVVSRIIVRGVSATMYRLTLDRLGLQTGRAYDGTGVDRRLSDYEGELRRRRYYEASFSHDIEVVDDGVGVHLLLDLQRGPRITIEFAGDEVPGGDPAELVPIEREGAVDEDLLEDSDQRITGFLNDLGYRDATVRHTREAAGDELSIVFTVDRGRLYEIGEIVFTGNVGVSQTVLAPLVGLEPGSPLVMRDLDIALAAIAEHYHQLGYATVRVEPVVTERSTGGTDPGGSVPVTCEISITEGVRTTVRSVVIEGNEFRTDDELRASIGSPVGGAYYAQRVVSDRGTIQLLYLNAGFERAVVSVEPRFGDELDVVDLVYRVNEGPQILVEHILVVGNTRVESETIRRELAITAGRPLGLADVAESRRRLNALGLFRRIDLREFSHGGGNRRDVVVVVEEAPATTLGYGGGFEVSQRLRRETDAEGSQAVERIEFAPRGFFEIGRRNLWGRNRSINLFTRVSVRRKNDPVDSVAATQASGLGFNEYRILATYREPRTFGLAWDVFVTGFVEQAIRTGFDLFSRGVNAEIRRQLTPTISASVGYGLGQNDTSNKQLAPEDERIVDILFEELRLSLFSGSLLRDTRDDVLDPSNGSLLSVDGQLAARAIGSEVGFVKTFVQAFVYRAVPYTSGIVFAGGARIGLAAGFERIVDVPVTPLPPSDQGPVGGSMTTFKVPFPDRSLPISQRFFAGGDTTVRGFALDRLGIPLGLPGGTISDEGFPQGGNAVIILNAELRVPVTRDLGLVGFIDAGNVYDLVGNVSLGQIRAGVGFGVRYRSPIGPIRVDLGFKLDRQEFGSGDTKQKERLTALHISIGQAF